MAAEEAFSMEMPDLQGLIQRLNMFEKEQNEAVRKALNDIGDNIAAAQRRLIQGVEGGDRLAKHISKGRVYTTRKGVLGITAGYQAGAFKTDSNGFNAGIVGMVREFGRPGKSTYRSKPTMTQTRNGKKVEVSKGTIQPHPHIRLGFDQTLEQNVQTLVDAVNAVIDKL